MAGKYVTGPMTIKEFEERRKNQYVTGPTTIGEFESYYRNYKNEEKQKQDAWDKYLRSYVNNVQYRNTMGAAQPFNRQQGPTVETHPYVYEPSKIETTWTPGNRTYNNSGRGPVTSQGRVGSASMATEYGGRPKTPSLSELEQQIAELTKQAQNAQDRAWSIDRNLDPMGASAALQEFRNLDKQIKELEKQRDELAAANNSRIQNTGIDNGRVNPQDRTILPDYRTGNIDENGRVKPENITNLPDYRTGNINENGRIDPENIVLLQGNNAPKGMLEPGNINLDSRTPVQNADGSISTERSFSVNIDGQEVLLPTVIDGRIVSEDEAIDHYYRTGEHLGKFDTPENADNYAAWLHQKQGAKYGNMLDPDIAAAAEEIAIGEPVQIEPTKPMDPVMEKENQIAALKSEIAALSDQGAAILNNPDNMNMASAGYASAGEQFNAIRVQVEEKQRQLEQAQKELEQLQKEQKYANSKIIQDAKQNANVTADKNGNYTIGGGERELNPYEIYEYTEPDKRSDEAKNQLDADAYKKYVEEHYLDEFNIIGEEEAWKATKESAEKIREDARKAMGSSWNADIPDLTIQDLTIQDWKDLIKNHPNLIEFPADYEENKEKYDRELYDFYHYAPGQYDAAGMNEASKEARDAQLEAYWEPIKSGKIRELRDYLENMGELGAANEYETALGEVAESNLKKIETEKERATEYEDMLATYSNLGDDAEFHSEYDQGVIYPETLREELATRTQTNNIDRIYSFICGGREAETWTETFFGDSNPRVMPDYSYSMMLLPEETETFKELYNKAKKEGREPKEAKAFLDALQPYLRSRYSDAQKIDFAENARKYPVLASIESLYFDLLAPAVDVARNVAHDIAGDKNTEDPNSAYYYGQQLKTVTQQTISKDLSQKYGDVIGKGYEHFMNSASNFLRAVVGPKGSGLKQFAASMSQFWFQVDQEATYRYLDAGYKYDEASARAKVDATEEVFEELLPFESMLKSGGNNVVISMVIQAANEFLQEFTGATLGEKVKGLLFGDSENERKNDIIAKQGYYNAKGDWIDLSKLNKKDLVESAKLIANKEFWDQAWEQGLGGAIGGWLGGTYGTTINAMNTFMSGKKINNPSNNFEGKTGSDLLVDTALGMKGTKSERLARDIDEKRKKGKKSSNYETGRLAATMAEETNEQVGQVAGDTLKNRIKKQLTDAGVAPERADGLADVMAQGLMNQGKLSILDRSKLAREHAAIELWRDYTSNKGINANMMGARVEVSEATKEQQSVAEVLQNVTGGTKAEANSAVESITEGAETADKEEVKKAGGSKGTGTEVLADGKIIDIGGMEMRKNADGEDELMLIPKDGGEAIAAADAKAVDENLAKAMQFFSSDGMKTASSRFANVVIKNIKDIRNIGTVMSDALRVRMDTMFGKTGTKTSLSSEMVEEIRNATMEDFNEAEENRVASQKAIKPGQGTTSYNGVQFGTADFAEAIKGLAKDIRQEAYAIGEIAKAAGFNVTLIYDKTNTKMQGWFSTDSGVTINLAGENAGGTHHSAMVTFAHEITHWLEANSREAYARLRSFVFDSLEKSGVNLTQRAQDIIANYQHNDMDIDLNGAIAEMVAQGCDQILTDENVIAHMRESDPTLFGNIRKAVQNLLNRVRSALSRAKGSMSYESRNLQNYLDQLGKLWNLAYDEARGQTVATEDVNRAAASVQASVQENEIIRDQEKYKGKDLSNDSTVYNYDFLKGLHPISEIKEGNINDVTNEDGNIDESKLSEIGIKNAIEEAGGIKKGNYVLVKNDYSGRTIVITKHGIIHSVHTDNNRTNRANARIAQKAGLLAKTALPINALRNEVNIKGTYAMASPILSEDGTMEKVAILTIEIRSGELLNMEIYDQLHAISGRKKNDGRKERSVRKYIPIGNHRSNTINITDFLEEINSTHKGILSKDVLERQNDKKPDAGYWVERAKFSVQDDIYDEAGKDAELQRLKAEAEKYRETRDSARSKYDSLIKSDDMKAFNDRIAKTNTDEENNKLIEEMLAWQEENGLDRLKNEADEAERKLKEAQKAYDNYQDQILQKTEQRMIEESGMNEADWRRKQAINQYGYTGDYREAGYLLPNGRMLNFCGSKGQHYGMRGNDHRDIGIVYATKQGSEAMIAFMNDGNIRVMAETPGVDIAKEPTTAQYTAIRNMAARFAGEEYFSVDFSDERGNNIGSLEYDGHVNPSKVVNDIKSFFRTGQVPQQSLASQFHYSVQDDAAYMDAVNSGDAQTAQDYVNAAAKANGYTITAFHGTGRADRVGTVFLPERATSGPMAFFTDSREIAGNYAQDKQDTSIAYDEDYGDYYNQFRVTLKDGKNVPVGKLWNTLSFAERQKITENARHITLDDDAEEIIYDKNAQNGVGNFTDYERKLHGWNSIDTLIDGWLEGGTLWDREGDFLKVLELAGIKNVTWNDPNARHEKVYDVYLNIQNPFDTGTMYTNKFLDDMAKWWKKQDHAKYESESMGADFWDKRSITVDEWIEDARREVEEGTSHNWTRIPDGVTAYLQAKGYDGIKDQGGKGGGAGHTVWIPFSSEQIKSADPYTYDDQGNIIPPSERFNSENRDIRYSIQDIGDQEAAQWMQSVNPTTLQTEAEKMLLDNFKSLQMRIDLKREQIEKTRRQIREIERTPESERTQEQKRMLKNLNIKMQNAMTVRDHAISELARITGTNGYARLMREQNRIFNNFIYGKTQEDVRQAVTQMDQSVDAISKRIEQNQKDIAEIEKDGSISRLKKALGTTTADKAAAELKKEFHSTWTRNEIRNFLDPILVKMANGEDFSSDVQELADILISSDERNVYEGLSELRGLRITVGHGMMQELRAKDSSLKEIRRRLAGTGITVRAAQKVNGTWEASTLEQDIESLRAEYPGMPDFGNEKDALENFVSWVEGMKQQNGAEFYNEKLADTMAVVMQKAAGVAHGIYIPTEAKAQKQVLALIDYVRGLNAKTESAEKALQDIAAEMARMKQANAQAIGMANILTQNVGEALRYYDRTAKLAMDTARMNKQSAIIEQLKSKQAEKILKNNEEWRNLIERDRQARVQAEKNAQKRNVINTDIKRMYRLLRDQSATKNMPEYMQALARDMIGAFVSNDISGVKVLRADPGQLAEAMRLLRAWKEQNGAANYGNIMDNLDEAEEAIGQALMLDRDVIYQTLNEWNSEIKGKNKLDTIQKRGEILERMQAAVSEIYNAIQAERTVQANKRRVTTQNQAYKVMVETKGKKYREWTGKAGGAIRAMHKMIVGGNMTPEYFFRMLNNGGLNDLWANYHDAENRNGLELHKAQERLAEIAKKHGYQNWDMGQKLRVDIGGEQVEMTLGQMMSLWATWKRENTLGPAMSEHLSKGGFYVEQNLREGILGRAEVQKKAHRVTIEDMARVGALLSEEQTAFINDVVGFMSNEMSQLGNEASMAAYGIKLYKEKYYYPFKMWDGIKSRKSNDSGNGANIDQAFHPSFSKTRLHGANNALVIGDFMQTASDHIAGMINYATMGLANDSMQKVLNEKMNDAMPDGNPQEGTVRNIRAILEEAYGREAVQYLAELQKQLNGGAVRIDKTVYDKAISLFRKNAVAGSLSVAAQQPLSYLRAATMIDAKYLGKALTQEYWKGSYKELLQHSGVAVIKEMGRFDMNAGQSAREYLTPDGNKTKWQAAWDQITDKATILPEKMDAWTWTRMWVAVKAEQHAEHPEMDMKSDEFLDMCGERFNDIMRRTQVYDSVLVRSENMRSQNPWVKSITSFMAEPTLTLNVLADAVRSAKNGEAGGKTLLAKAGATFLMSAAVQAAVKALFSTGRSPDDKKTWFENWLNRLASNMISEVDPIQMIPGYSDLITLLKDGKLEDDAMGAVGKLFTAGKGTIDVITGNGKKGLWRDLEDSVAQITQLFTNLPAKNIMRDMRAMYNWFIEQPYAARGNDMSVIKNQFMDTFMNADNMLGVINKWLGEAGYSAGNKAYYQRIYDAKKAGNEKAAQEMIDYLINGKGVKEKTIQTGVQTAAKNDKNASTVDKAQFLIDEGASSADDYIREGLKSGEISENEAKKLLKQADPKKTDDDIYWTIDRIKYQLKTGADKVNGTYYRLWDAMNANSANEIGNAVTELTKHGANTKSIKSQITQKYKEAYVKGNSDERRRIRDAIQKAYKKLGLTAEDANKVIDKWKPASNSSGSLPVRSMPVGDQMKTSVRKKRIIGSKDQPAEIKKYGEGLGKINTEKEDMIGAFDYMNNIATGAAYKTSEETYQQLVSYENGLSKKKDLTKIPLETLINEISQITGDDNGEYLTEEASDYIMEQYENDTIDSATADDLMQHLKETGSKLFDEKSRERFKPREIKTDSNPKTWTAEDFEEGIEYTKGREWMNLQQQEKILQDAPEQAKSMTLSKLMSNVKRITNNNNPIIYFSSKTIDFLLKVSGKMDQYTAEDLIRYLDGEKMFA